MKLHDIYTLYTATWCKPCAWLKDELAKEGIVIVIKDIDDPETAIEYSAIGSQFVPALHNHKDHVLTENSSTILELLKREAKAIAEAGH